MNDVADQIASETSSKSPASYNQVFEKFVGDADSGMDIVGMIAYGIYKNAKREWAMDLRKRFGRSPDASDLASYHASWTPQLIQNARNSAQSSLVEYADTVIEKEEPRILREALKGNWWKNVVNSILANLIYTVLLIAIAIVLARAGIDLIGIVKDSADSSSIQPSAHEQTKTD